MDENNNLRLILTLTSKCNCNCTYCFENKHKQNFDTNAVKEKTLSLLKDVCLNLQNNDKKYLTIDFWGGEPFLEIDYIKSILSITSNNDRILYKFFTNGTLIENMLSLEKLPNSEMIKKNSIFSISYDGRNLNEIQRGVSAKTIEDNAICMVKHGFNVHLKSTIAFENLHMFDTLWKSFADLYKNYKHDFKLSPSFDSLKSDISSYYATWDTQCKKLLKNEYWFFVKYGFFMHHWLRHPKKNLYCDLNGKLIIHNDGNIYPCYGFAYLNPEKRKNFVFSHINEIDSLIPLFNIRRTLEFNNKCDICKTSFCVNCRTWDVDNKYETRWERCNHINDQNCHLYKTFSNYQRILVFLLLKNIKNIMFSYKNDQYIKITDSSETDILNSLTYLKKEILEK